ncbi:MAG: ABC transporter permease [Chloroflexi bacterium]|nr:ABC transporter permease [Chloroflexota bacterium]
MNNSGLPPLLWMVGWRYLVRHPWQTVLMILGISLGVAVVVSINVANASAARAFELSTASLTGSATHEIVGGPQGLNDKLYAQLVDQGVVSQAAPVISQYITSPQLGSQPLQLLGIDPFADAPFRSYLGVNGALSVSQLIAFLTRPGAVFISTDLAQRYHLSTGDTIQVAVNGNTENAIIAGLLQPSDSLSQHTLDGVILADISTAQELTNHVGKLDRIDLTLPKDASAQIKTIEAHLPAGVSLVPIQSQESPVEQMTAAFHLNLTALSLLALLVGLFLIYNTMTFSIVQRRSLFGTLRCLGVTRREIFWLVSAEALVVGSLGALLGIGLGIILAQSTVRMVTQTINDLFFTTTVRDVGIPISSLVEGGVLGVVATLATALPPAREAASVPPQAALTRSVLESKAHRNVTRTALGGLAVIGAGTGVLLFPTNNLIVGFAGTFAVVTGFALLASFVMVALMLAAQPVTGGLFGTLGRMAPRNLTASLSRTSVAVAALMVAVAVTIGVNLMVGSFRYTVIAWLNESLQGDIYISVPGFSATTATTAIDPAELQAIEHWPGVARADLLNEVMINSPQGPIQVDSTNNPDVGAERLFLAREQSPQATWQALQAGSVLVSEPLANRLGIPRRGGSIELVTPQGARSFPVVGIFYDYSSSQGMVVMSLDEYRQIWNDNRITAISLRLAPGAQVDQVTRSLQDGMAKLGFSQNLLIRPNRVLRQDVLAIFDRTFAITGALNVLTTIIAFIGVLSSLLLLQLEKQHEVGILRAIGMTVRELWGLTMLETGLMGLAAGLLSMPTGYALSLILIYIINRRSFNWTLQMAIQPGSFAQALLIAVIAALLAGIYPAYKLGKMAAADAIRFE